MSFFSGTKSKAKLNPRTAESKAGGNWLMDFMKTWGSPGSSLQYPVQGTAGLSPMQQFIQDELGKYMTGANESYNLAMGEHKKTLEGGYDPRTSDYYRGFRQEAEDLRGESTTAIRQRANMGGMLQSSPAQAIEAENNRQINSMILQELGRMFEIERGRKTDAAKSIQDTSSQRLNQAAGVTSLADLPRAVEQDRLNAAYTAAIQTLLHPYNVQSSIAAAMMDYSPGVYKQEGGPSGLTNIQSAMGSISGIKTSIQDFLK